MAERIIALTFLWLVASASALASDLETRYHVSTAYRDSHGERHSLPPVRVFVRHDSLASITNLSASENCSVMVGKSDPLGLFIDQESFTCVSDGSRVFVSREILSKILERSLIYSIRFSREDEMNALLNDFRSKGTVSKLSEKSDSELSKKLKTWFQKSLGDLTKVHSFSLSEQTEFKLQIPKTSSEFVVKLEFVNTKLRGEK